MVSYGALVVTMVVVVVTMQWLGCNFAEGYPEEELVVRLPGQPKVLFRQYAGYVEVDSKTGRSLFYYFVEAATQPETKPLTLWLNGVMEIEVGLAGPGCSSVGGGAFTELGPFYPTGDGRGLRINPMSWNKASNLLFVESPAGVGWSYSNTSSDYNTGDETTGHYIPQLADAILSYNRQSSGFKINVKGIAIGNPLLKLNTDTSAVYEYLWSHGIISDELRLEIIRQCDFNNIPNVSNACIKATTEAGVVSQFIDVDDVLRDLCYPSIVQQELRLKKMATHMSIGVDVCMTYERKFYFNLPEVQHALHANRTRLPYEWSMCSTLVNYRGIDSNISMLPLLKRTSIIIPDKKKIAWKLRDGNYQNIGDQDSIVPFLGTRTNIRELAHDLNFSTTLPYGHWFHKDQVGGWVTEYGKLLTFATVRGAAHMVPYAQPARALHMFSCFVRGRRLPNNTHYPHDE
ncbi:hypothetical protein YC2023_095529 [Brassica napus]